MSSHYLGLCSFCNGWNVKELAGVVLDTRETDQGNGVSLTLNGRDDVLCPQGELSLTL